ncbi:MAG: hypothetical protein H6671_04020 [Anaerolineaceae bacterium]|nr:hypothetical protein [Anaerolineaceae bacterium]
MHISIFVYGTWGNIRPHVVLGTALQKAVHEVQVVASPSYEKRVRDRDLSFYLLMTTVNNFARENASLMCERFIRQLQTLRTHIAPLFMRMVLEMMEATRDSDVLMTVEFGVSLLDVIKANKLKPIFANPAHIPAKPGCFPVEGWYNRLGYTLAEDQIRRIFTPPV